MRPSRLALLAVVLLLTVGGCATHSSFAPAAGSWIDPAATASGPLLFISDLGDYSVDVYSIPNLKLVEKIRGFNEPEGECSDAHGNVWIVNEDPQEILEFKPGSKSPIATLDDPTGSPVACAVNLHDGDLAVTNVFNGSGPGGVLVYKGARGTPRAYLNPNQFYYYFAGYDAHGNLYASGLTSKNTYSLSLLRAGAQSMSSISISGGTLYFPGAVFFSGPTIVLGDQQCGNKKTSCLYEATVTGKTATIARTIPLTGSCDVAQVALSGSQIFAGDACPHHDSRSQGWSFPGGGKPFASSTGVTNPIGAAVSGS
ncbi:MAG TPA: hypothetical protein VGX91_09975 [Candidatus Cybelea sp.]|jgi:hypothetical protein|nr:hypothetical protein [Candidatus Cybelea sp.]